MTIYKNSDGKDSVLEEMDANYLLNSFAKKIRLKEGGSIVDDELKMLRGEIFRRIIK